MSKLRRSVAGKAGKQAIKQAPSRARTRDGGGTAKVVTKKPKPARAVAAVPPPAAAAKPSAPVAKPSAPVARVSIRPGTAAILAIGDEVLRGEINNSNATFLSDRLFDAGYEVRAHRVVSDEPADIRAAIESLSSEAAVIIATGGLGPTDDDRTVDVVCDLLGVAGTEHKSSLDAMKQRFSAHGFEMTPNNLRQVRVPEGSVAFSNPAGIAPGFCVGIGET